MLDFLSGRGPNPIPENKRQKAGPLGTKFIREAMEDIAEQDRANERKAAPSVADDLMAVMRLVSDKDLDWVQAYCLAMALQKGTAIGLGDSNVSKIESAVRDAVASTAEEINLIRSPAPSR